MTATVRDEDGAEWSVRQRFAAGKRPGSIDVTVRVSVDQSREAVFLPMLVIVPGLGSFGEAKNQAVFAGLEYLDKNELSSSEADIVGLGAKRQVPDTLKITVPLMAVQANDRYIGLLWEERPEFAACFDSLRVMSPSCSKRGRSYKFASYSKGKNLGTPKDASMRRMPCMSSGVLVAN